MNRRFPLVLVSLALLAAPAFAEDDPMSPLAIRKRSFADMGAAFKAINDQMKQPRPVMMLVKAYAQQLVRYSKEPAPGVWFAPGSGPAPGVKTSAKTEIWSRPDEFNKLWAAYGVQANKLLAAAAARDADAVSQAVKDTGASCAACHRAFRSDDK